MYSTKIDGKTIEFGTSGLLYRSNKLMYDRGTDSLWNQFRGEPVIGRLAESGLKLKILPSTVTTWGQWLAEHPDTTVLNIITGVYPQSYYPPESDVQSFYYDYRAQPDTMFPVWQQSGALPTKSQVLGLELGGEAKAYPLEALRSQPVVNDVVGGQSLVILTTEGEVGSRAYRRDDRQFRELLEVEATQPSGLPAVVDAAGNRWLQEEDALVNEADPAQRLDRLSARVAYWFGWYAFNPDTTIFGGQ